MPTHSLSSNLLPLSTTVAMESGSEENRLCQSLTKMLARGRLGLFLEVLLPRSIFAVSSLAPSVGVKSRTIAWSRSPSAEADILIDLHTLALTPCPTTSANHKAHSL